MGSNADVLSSQTRTRGSAGGPRGQPASRLRPFRTLDGDGTPLAAPAWAGPHLLIAAHRDGRVRAHGLPSRTAL
ncbi:hypothetical protein AB0O76_14635 [Streptomyces sp. NPDC086554]|uniref:hypothetical protein n=1 Tax=Streptomyces sp. NPDC086554 TaxID=3154864 RepID=UPI003439D6AE